MQFLTSRALKNSTGGSKRDKKMNVTTKAILRHNINSNLSFFSRHYNTLIVMYNNFAFFVMHNDYTR